MNAQQLLDWINQYRPKWLQRPEYAWLKQQIQSGNQAVLDSVARDIQNNVTDLQQVNTNVAYNAQQQSAQQQAARDPLAQLNQGGGLGDILFGSGFSDEAKDALRQYFASDPVLKNDPQRQFQIVQHLNTLQGQFDGVSAVQAAREFNWSTASAQQRIQYPQQPGDWTMSDLQQWGKDHKLDITGLVDTIKKMGPAQQYQALQTANQKLGQLPDQTQFPQFYTQSVVDSTLTSVLQQPGATSQQPTSSTAPVPGQQDITQAQKEYYHLITGQDFTTAYNNFAQAYGIAASYRDQTTGMQGTGSLWTTQQTGDTPSLGAGWELNAQPLSPQQQQSGQYRVSPAQFFFMQANQANMQGGKINIAKQVEDTESGYWASNHNGQPLPEGARAAIWNAISQMSTEQLYELSKNPSGLTAALTSQGSVVDTALSDWENSAAGQAYIATNDPRIAKIQSDYLQYTGQQMPLDKAKEYLGMPESDVVAAFNRMGDPRHSGFSYGSWYDAQQRITNLFETNGLGTPTDAEIARYNGMSSTMIQDQIDLMPSNVPGVNRGLYQDYFNEFQSIQHALPGDLIDSLLPDAHAHVTGGGQK